MFSRLKHIRVFAIQQNDNRVVVWKRTSTDRCWFEFYTEDVVDTSTEMHEVVDATIPHKFILDIDAAGAALDHKILLADIVNAMELQFTYQRNKLRNKQH